MNLLVCLPISPTALFIWFRKHRRDSVKHCSSLRLQLDLLLRLRLIHPKVQRFNSQSIKHSLVYRMFYRLHSHSKHNARQVYRRNNLINPHSRCWLIRTDIEGCEASFIMYFLHLRCAKSVNTQHRSSRASALAPFSCFHKRVGTLPKSQSGFVNMISKIGKHLA